MQNVVMCKYADVLMELFNDTNARMGGRGGGVAGIELVDFVFLHKHLNDILMCFFIVSSVEYFDVAYSA